MEVKKLLEALNEFNAEETRKPTQEDLDDIFDAKDTLNKCEWFVNNQKDLDILIKAQNILEKVLKENE